MNIRIFVLEQNLELSKLLFLDGFSGEVILKKNKLKLILNTSSPVCCIKMI